MSRIPYRATGRPLSGPNGRFKNAAPPKVAVPTPPVEVAAPPVEVEAPSAPVGIEVEAPVVEAPAPVEVESPVVAAEVAVPVAEDGAALAAIAALTEEPVAAAEPQWDASWTKANLLALAVSKGLPVNVSNTKADIIGALNAVG